MGKYSIAAYAGMRWRLRVTASAGIHARQARNGTALRSACRRQRGHRQAVRRKNGSQTPLLILMRIRAAMARIRRRTYAVAVSTRYAKRAIVTYSAKRSHYNKEWRASVVGLRRAMLPKKNRSLAPVLVQFGISFIRYYWRCEEWLVSVVAGRRGSQWSIRRGLLAGSLRWRYSNVSL